MARRFLVKLVFSHVLCCCYCLTGFGRVTERKPGPNHWAWGDSRRRSLIYSQGPWSAEGCPKFHCLMSHDFWSIFFSPIKGSFRLLHLKSCFLFFWHLKPINQISRLQIPPMACIVCMFNGFTHIMHVHILTHVHMSFHPSPMPSFFTLWNKTMKAFQDLLQGWGGDCCSVPKRSLMIIPNPAVWPRSS